MANIFGLGMGVTDFDDRVMRSGLIGDERVSIVKKLREQARPRLMLLSYEVLDEFNALQVEKYVLESYEWNYTYAYGLFFGQFDWEPDIKCRQAIVNLLSRPLLLIRQNASEQEADIGMTIPVDDTYNIPSHDPKQDHCLWDFPELKRFQEKYVRFDFDGPNWQIAVGKENIEEQAPKTGTGPMIIPYDNGHVSLTLKGPQSLVALLNLQSRVNLKKELHIISVNARFLLFNYTSFPLRVTAFAVRSSDGDYPITKLPLSSPSVQAATVVTEPSHKEEEAAALTGKPQPYPLELWHLLGTGTGDTKVVPYLALSSLEAEGYGCLLRLHMSQNNSRLTVPLHTNGSVDDVSLIIQLEDREMGQQMIIRVNDETSIVNQKECNIPLLPAPDVPDSTDLIRDYLRSLCSAVTLNELSSKTDVELTSTQTELGVALPSSGKDGTRT